MNTAIVCNNKKDSEKFHSRIKGRVIISSEVFVLANMTESNAEITVSDIDLYDRVSEFAFKNAINYQELFQDKTYIYMSCFVYDVCSFKKEFEKDEIFKSLFKNETDHILISFPDRLIKSKGA